MKSRSSCRVAKAPVSLLGAATLFSSPPLSDNNRGCLPIRCNAARPHSDNLAYRELAGDIVSLSYQTCFSQVSPHSADDCAHLVWGTFVGLILRLVGL